MKTLEQIIVRKSECLDGRDVSRLSKYIPASDWPKLGLTPVEGFDVSKHIPKELSRENVLGELAHDLDFAFEKALNQRGISSGLMYEVIKMWMWVLDDDLSEFDHYAQYGLPLFKAVAIKYGLPNPIGEDTGSESKYAC